MCEADDYHALNEASEQRRGKRKRVAPEFKADVDLPANASVDTEHGMMTVTVKPGIGMEHKNLPTEREDEGPGSIGEDNSSSGDDQRDCKKTKADSSVTIKVKRDRKVRRQDRSNRSEKNWTTAMKRHWKTKQKDIAMALITIKRDQLDEVPPH